MSLSENIRKTRVGLGLTQVEFAQKVGVTQVGVHGWESGSRQPNAENLRVICKTFGLSADGLLDLPVKGGDLSDAERTLLNTYRSLDAFGKSAVEIICSHEKERVYGSGASVAGERYIPKYISSAAAGLAAPIDESGMEMMLVDGSVPERADYAVVINGRSMEPYIQDGSTVFVQKTDELKTGEVGIFSVNGAIVCKKLYKTSLGDVYLVSVNPDEQASNVFVPRDSSDTVTCLGRVILKKQRQAKP